MSRLVDLTEAELNAKQRDIDDMLHLTMEFSKNGTEGWQAVLDQIEAEQQALNAERTRRWNKTG